MWLVNDLGEAVRGRCKATNQCEYCAVLGAVENAELLALDALAGEAPAIWLVLTTPRAEPDPAAFYRSRGHLMRAIRRRWPAAQYAALVEFTTGYGERSGGLRRPHWNLLLKGIPAEEVDQVRDVVDAVWCPRVDASPQGQFVGTIGEAGGLMRYIALHFQKESQAPPQGWRGHRFLKSRGYLATATPEAREAARASLRHKRELWRAIRRGLQGHDAELAAHEALEAAALRSWRLVQVDPAGRSSSRAGGAGPFGASSEGASGPVSRSRSNCGVAPASEPGGAGRTTPVTALCGDRVAAAVAPPPLVERPAALAPVDAAVPPGRGVRSADRPEPPGRYPG